MNDYRFNICPHCNGKLIWDVYEKELKCLQCGRSQPNEKSQDVTADPPEQVKPDPRIDQLSPYIASGPIYTNGHWYAIHEIKFSRDQMAFLIKHLPLLQEGKYPHNPIGTGYIDMHPRKTRAKHRAYFELPVNLATEVETRLERCGQDGLLLEAFLCWQKSPRYLTKCFNLSEMELERRLRSALKYISGWRRKNRSYKEFKNHKKANSYSNVQVKDAY